MAITITHKDENDETSPAMYGDVEHLKVSAKLTFPEIVFESLSGKKPTAKQLKLFNLILNLCFDHGPNPPSASATIAATKEGKEMGEAVAAGVTQINERHGGAIEPAMNFFYTVQKEKPDITELVKEYLDNNKLIGGFGHRIYKQTDPRADLILENLGTSGKEFIKIAQIVGEAIDENRQRHLVLNVDGAIAVVLCSWGWKPEWSKGIFIIARAGGLVAHYLNNKT